MCVQVTTHEVCLSIPLVVQNKVAKVQEASVVVYDYYESSKKTQTLLSSSTLSCRLTFDPARQLGGQLRRTTQSGGGS